LNDESVYVSFEIAVDAILHTPHRLALAKNIRSDLERRIRDWYSSERLKGMIYGLLGSLLLTLISCAALASIVTFVCLPGLCPDPKSLVGVVTFSDRLVLFAQVVALGVLGACVSILTQLRNFTSVKRIDPSLLSAIAFTRPFISMSFAILIFLILEGKLVTLGNITHGHEQYAYLLLVLAFIAGFSEPFVPSILRKLEEVVGQADTLGSRGDSRETSNRG
jgi:hypothetical protein